MNGTATRASVRQVTEADWLTKARDRCAEASKTQSPSFVSRIVVIRNEDDNGCRHVLITVVTVMKSVSGEVLGCVPSALW
jgi:hypothetical protein